MVEAFPWDPPPKYVLRDRDRIYGEIFRRRIKSLGMKEVLIGPRSPWQNPYVERLVGSIRRDCLDHHIIVNERHLRRVLRAYVTYYHTARTHLPLAKQCPPPRPSHPPDSGNIIAFPHLGGLHHEYRRAARAPTPLAGCRAREDDTQRNTSIVPEGPWSLSRSGDPQPPPHLYPITSPSSQLITVNKRHSVRIGFLATTGGRTTPVH